MPFDPNSAKKAGKKSKRGPAKKEGPSIKEKMEMLYEKVLDDLLINQDKLTKTERVKVLVTLSNYIFQKTKSVRDKFTLEQLKEKITSIQTQIQPNSIFGLKKSSIELYRNAILYCQIFNYFFGRKKQR
ncbi:MAG: hypothetical protein P8I31_03625 [Bacteroidia bacterium]|nr:hypothetical protein [Bacteroidia bacterium]